MFDKFGKVNREYEPVQVSMYCVHILRWFALFPRSQFYLINGNNFIENRTPELQNVERFLGLPSAISKKTLMYDNNKGYYCHYRSGIKRCLKNKGRSHTYVSPEQIVRLKRFFAPYSKNSISSYRA